MIFTVHIEELALPKTMNSAIFPVWEKKRGDENKSRFHRFDSKKKFSYDDFYFLSGVGGKFIRWKCKVEYSCQRFEVGGGWKRAWSSVKNGSMAKEFWSAPRQPGWRAQLRGVITDLWRQIARLLLLNYTTEHWTKPGILYRKSKQLSSPSVGVLPSYERQWGRGIQSIGERGVRMFHHRT